MTASPPFWAVWTDVFWCLGIGLCIAAGRDALGLLFGESRPVRFVLDLAGFAAAAIAVCGFAAQLSASGTARWYMAAAMALGTLGWSVTASPLLHRGMELLLRILAFPLHWTAQKVVRPIKRKLIQAVFSAKQKHSRRKQGKKRKKQKKCCKIQNGYYIIKNTQAYLPALPRIQPEGGRIAAMKKRKKMPKWFLPAMICLLCGYLVVNVIQCQVTIGSKRQELQSIQTQVEEQKADNEELNRALSDGESAIIERIAREQGYARPNERIFYDISGK